MQFAILGCLIVSFGCSNPILYCNKILFNILILQLKSPQEMLNPRKYISGLGFFTVALIVAGQNHLEYATSSNLGLYTRILFFGGLITGY